MATFIKVETPTGDKTIDVDKVVVIHHQGLTDLVEFSSGQFLVILTGQIGGDDAEGQE